MQTLKNWEDLLKDDSTWDCKEGLEEALFSIDVLLEDTYRKSDRQKLYKPGDIIMTNKAKSVDGTDSINRSHRIYIISAVEEKDGLVKYQGYLMTSKSEKFNTNSSFPTLYISDYSTILAYGPEVHTEAGIKIDTIFEFTNEDLSDTGSFKGHVSQEFTDFVNKGVELFNNKKDLSKYTWDAEYRTKEEK